MTITTCSCTAAERRWAVDASAVDPNGHDQESVRVVVLGAVLGLTGDHGRLARLGERQPGQRLGERAEAVEQELRVETDRDVLALERALDRLRRLRVLALAGLESQRAVRERQADRGVALGDERHAL